MGVWAVSKRLVSRVFGKLERRLQVLSLARNKNIISDLITESISKPGCLIDVKVDQNNIFLFTSPASRRLRIV